MPKDLKVEIPRNKGQWTKALIVGSVVVVIAVTPTLFDAYDAWEKHPEVHYYLMAWYLLVILVALTAWRVLYNE
jgi:hypothetical protein